VELRILHPSPLCFASLLCRPATAEDTGKEAQGVALAPAANVGNRTGAAKTKGESFCVRLSQVRSRQDRSSSTVCGPRVLRQQQGTCFAQEQDRVHHAVTAPAASPAAVSPRGLPRGRQSTGTSNDRLRHALQQGKNCCIAASTQCWSSHCTRKSGGDTNGSICRLHLCSQS
jgi:hypothetical protein